MKSKKLLLILSIVEIIILILFIVTLKSSWKSSVEIFIDSLTNSWLASGSNSLSKYDMVIMRLNNIFMYIFLIVFILRFIFVSKKVKIFMLLFLLFLGLIYFSLVVFSWGETFKGILFISSIVGCLITYIYSHIICFKGMIL